MQMLGLPAQPTLVMNENARIAGIFLWYGALIISSNQAAA